MLTPTPWIDHVNPGEHLPPLVVPGVLAEVRCWGRVGSEWFGKTEYAKFIIEKGNCFRVSPGLPLVDGWPGGHWLVHKYRVWMEPLTDDADASMSLVTALDDIVARAT